MSASLLQFTRKQRGRRGIYSVCTAQRWVIEAAMQQALHDGTDLLIEATSAQVNQGGGYTGMTPSDFRTYVFRIAEYIDFNPAHLILGGDHLGPNPWQSLSAEEAMQRAMVMVHDFAAAGFSKIHLDASMSCAGDPSKLPDEIVAERAATLCAVAETAASRARQPLPVYVIGTEVPAPGGASHELNAVTVTTRQSVEQTLTVHRDTFRQTRLGGALERIMAIVVQPGVEFNHDSVVEYDAAKAAHLRHFLDSHPELVFEAHSTDYQPPHAYHELVRDGFAVLKVGPALTFALREALFSLAAIEAEIISDHQQSRLRKIIERVMIDHPVHWKKYYPGRREQQRILRVYSYSDRIRYYWQRSDVTGALDKLVTNLKTASIPETLFSQYMPEQYAALRAGEITDDPVEMIRHRVRSAIQPYSAACLGRGRVN